MSKELDMPRAVRMARAHAGMRSNLEVAKRAGLCEQAVARLAKGRGNPSISTLVGLARAADVPVSQVLLWAEGAM